MKPKGIILLILLLSESNRIHANNVKAGFNEFPNLHPMVVHVPIMLILLAAIISLVNIYFSKTELNWIITIFSGVGALGAFAAANWFHPHTQNLTKSAGAVFEMHDKYATFTIWLSIVAFLIQLVNHFMLKKKRWGTIIVSIFLLGGTYTVSEAAHYGSQLAYIEGVGPQGNFLEKNHSH